MSKEEKYREIALKLLKEYIDSEQTVIGEFSGDFQKAAEILKDRAMKYLKALGYGEEKFAELVADTWLLTRLLFRLAILKNEKGFGWQNENA